MTEHLRQPPFSQVFILCTPRSGSSLLRYILDTHPAICCPGELSLGQLCKDLYTAFYYTVGQVRASSEESRDALARPTLQIRNERPRPGTRRAQARRDVGGGEGA